MTTHGSISGTVADALVTAECNPLVYVYEGSTVTPDDMGSVGAQPLAVAMVDNMDPEAAGAWTYSVPFLDPMTYTVAFTCEDVPDDPAMDDAITFMQPQDAIVSDGGDTPIDFL